MTIRIDKIVKTVIVKKIVGVQPHNGALKMIQQEERTDESGRKTTRSKIFGSMMLDKLLTSSDDVSIPEKIHSNNSVTHLHSILSPSHFLGCIELMESSSSREENRKGLSLFSLLVKFRIPMTDSSNSMQNDASHAVIFGGNCVTGRKLRQLLLTFLYDHTDTTAATTFEFDEEESSLSDASDENYTYMDEGSSFCDSLEGSCCEEDGARGLHCGSLHGPALRVLVNCLEQILSERETMNEAQSSSSSMIDFSCTFWKKLSSTLGHNIEKGHSAEISINSLRCLRLLQKLESSSINSLIQYSLLPFIMELQEYGKVHDYPMIHDESTKLLRGLQNNGLE